MSTGGALSTCLFLFIIKHCTLFYVKGKRSGKRALNLLVLVVILSTNLCQLFVYIFQLFVYKNQLIFSCLFTKVSCLSERHLVVKLCTKSFSYLFIPEDEAVEALLHEPLDRVFTADPPLFPLPLTSDTA